MDDKEFRNKFKEEMTIIDIKMSNRLKNTKIVIEDNKVKKQKTNIFTSPVFISVISVCFILIVVAGIFLFKSPQENLNLTSYIMEINPSICIIAGANDEVINICALNDDADEIVSNERLDSVQGLHFEKCVNIVMEIVYDAGYFEDYQETIKLYAINDDDNKRKENLNGFEKIMKKNLNKLGVEQVEFEKHEMGIDDFKEKLGLEEDFKSLDDMHKYLKDKDRKHNPQHEPQQDFAPDIQQEESPKDESAPEEMLPNTPQESPPDDMGTIDDMPLPKHQKE